MKRNEAKKLKRKEAKNYCFCFAKRSEKEAKRFLFRFVSLRSEKKYKRKWDTLAMGQMAGYLDKKVGNLYVIYNKTGYFHLIS